MHGVKVMSRYQKSRVEFGFVFICISLLVVCFFSTFIYFFGLLTVTIMVVLLVVFVPMYLGGLLY